MFLRDVFFYVIFFIMLMFTPVSNLSAMEEPPCHCLDCEKESVSIRLQSQEKINETVIGTARKVYQKINQNWKYSSLKTPMSTDSAFWEPTWVEGKIQVGEGEQTTQIPTLRLRGDAKNLKAAIEDLINKPATLECTIASQAVLIYCLHDILGSSFFNPYARTLRELYPGDDFFHALAKQFIVKKEGNAVPGSITYINNIAFYIQFKPHGSGRGINLICTSEGEYLGFAPLFKAGSKTSDDIKTLHWVEFCRQDDIENVAHYHQEFSNIYKKDIKSFYKLHDESQTSKNYYKIFNKEDLEEFINKKGVKKIY